VHEAKVHYPNLRPLFVGYDDDEPRVFVTMSPSMDPKPNETQDLVFDRHTGKTLDNNRPGRTYAAEIAGCIGLTCTT
jgi:hypothetical protein